MVVGRPAAVLIIWSWQCLLLKPAWPTNTVGMVVNAFARVVNVRYQMIETMYGNYQMLVRYSHESVNGSVQRPFFIRGAVFPVPVAVKVLFQEIEAGQ